MRGYRAAAQLTGPFYNATGFGDPLRVIPGDGEAVAAQVSADGTDIEAGFLQGFFKLPAPGWNEAVT